MGHHPRGTTTAQLDTRRLWQALPGRPPQHPGQSVTGRQEAAAGRGAGPEPSLGPAPRRRPRVFPLLRCDWPVSAASVAIGPLAAVEI